MPSEHEAGELLEERFDDIEAIERLLDSYSESLVCGYFGADVSGVQSPPARIIATLREYAFFLS